MSLIDHFNFRFIFMWPIQLDGTASQGKKNSIHIYHRSINISWFHDIVVFFVIRFYIFIYHYLSGLFWFEPCTFNPWVSCFSMSHRPCSFYVNEWLIFVKEISTTVNFQRMFDDNGNNIKVTRASRFDATNLNCKLMYLRVFCDF